MIQFNQRQKNILLSIAGFGVLLLLIQVEKKTHYVGNAISVAWKAFGATPPGRFMNDMRVAFDKINDRYLEIVTKEKKVDSNVFRLTSLEYLIFHLTGLFGIYIAANRAQNVWNAVSSATPPIKYTPTPPAPKSKKEEDVESKSISQLIKRVAKGIWNFPPALPFVFIILRALKIEVPRLMSDVIWALFLLKLSVYWFEEMSNEIYPRERQVAYRSPAKKDPTFFRWIPEHSIITQDQGSIRSKKNLRKVFGHAVGLLVLILGFYDIPTLGLVMTIFSITVTALTKILTPNNSCKLKFMVYIQLAWVGMMGIIGLFAVVLFPPKARGVDSEPKEKPQGPSDWLNPFMIIFMYSLMYITPAALAVYNLRYLQSRKIKLQSKSNPGEAVRISDNLFKSIPTGQLCSYFLLLVIYIGQIIVDAKYPRKDPFDWQMTAQLIAILMIILFNGLWATFNGGLKGWWNYSEEWYPPITEDAVEAKEDEEREEREKIPITP